MAQPLPINLEVERMCSYLASLSFTVTRDWLTGCVEYFREENAHYRVSDLQEFVRKQWELSDLRDSSGGSLPSNLQNQMKITLRGKYAVQIESILNISEPAYGQMQKIRKVDIGNIEETEKKPESWEPRPGRMLKLKLCDGQQQAEALEYKPLRMLNEHILPGTKILIIGPVDCRRGIFFLKPENVKMIGGEVDSLLIVNHMENILARTLGLPENQDPFSSASDAAPTQPPSTAVSETQRSTYTPSIAATPAAPSSSSGSQTNVRAAGRGMTQQRIEDVFRQRPAQETSADALDESLDGTGWTVDDLLAEEDDAFLELAEQSALVAVSSHITSTTSRQASDFPCQNRVVQNKQNVSSSAGGNAVFKVPQPPINNSKQNTNRKSGGNSSNPFLADDAYIDALDLDWEEEMDEFINAPSTSSLSTSASKSTTGMQNVNRSKPSTSKTTNATSSFEMDEFANAPSTSASKSTAGMQNFNRSKPSTSKTTNAATSFEMDEFINDRSTCTASTSASKSTNVMKNFNRNEPSSSKTTNATSSFKWPEMPQNNRQSKQFSAGRTVLESQQKNNFSSFPSTSSNSIMRQNINNEMKETSVNRGAPSNTLSSRVPTPCSSRSSDARMQFSSEFTKPNQDSRDTFRNVNFNRSPLRLPPNQQQMSKTFNQQSPKNVTFSPPSDAFENNEDWADAYLSSHNSSFVNTFDGLEAVSSPKSQVNRMDFSPRGAVSSLKRPSSALGSAKSTETFACAGPSEPKMSHLNTNSEGARGSFLEPRSHLRPAISSPSCIRDETEVEFKAPEASSSSRSFLDCKPSASNCSKSLSPGAVISPSKKKRAAVTPTKPTSVMSPEPFEYLIHVLQSSAKMSGTHRIKGTVKTLLSQLKVEAGHGWSLSVKLCDGTATLDVQFSPLVLDEIIGMSAQEFKKMKRDVPNNPLLKDKLIKKLEKTRDVLINLNCFFDIKFEPGKMAQVVKLSEITAEDVHKLKVRLKDS